MLGHFAQNRAKPQTSCTVAIARDISLLSLGDGYIVRSQGFGVG